VKYIPAICFALIPFGVWGQNIFFGHANTLILSATLLLFLCDYNDIKLNGWLKAVGVYLSCWIAYVFSVCFIGKYPHTWSMAMIESILFIWAGMIFFMAVYKGSLKKEVWFNFICSVALVQSVIGILQWAFSFDPVRFALEQVITVMGQMDYSTPVGTLGNQNFLVAFLAISLPFFFRDKWKYCVPIILYALILTKTTTAIGAAIIGSVYFFFGWKWAVASIAPAFILYAIKYNGIIFTNERVLYWLDAWRSTSHSWQTLLFGWGPGITWKSGNMLHSEYVNTFFNYGLIGLMIMIGYIASVHKMNRILLASFIIICIDMIGNHALHLTTTAVLIILIIALIERQKQEDFIYGR
jgi:hypothetical protein